jgi:hypothetical protein
MRTPTKPNSCGLVSAPAFVGWVLHHGRWRAGCSANTRPQVHRLLALSWGEAATVRVEPMGVVPADPAAAEQATASRP